MRRDFKKVLVDTTRSQKGPNRDVMELRRERIVLDEDGDLYEEPARGVRGYRMKGYDRKELGDHVAPLWRYLEKHVGRPWDKVFSEIKDVCPTGGAVNEHIYDHVRSFVKKDVTLVDGKPHYLAGDTLIPLTCAGGTQTWGSFWVHPENGILRRSKVVPRKKYPSGFVGWRNREKSRKPEPEIRVERDGIEFIVESHPETVKVGDQYDKYLKRKGFELDENTLTQIRLRLGLYIRLRQVS